MQFFPAFKEWALVCEALGEGKQNILIRKGGIAEGRSGFHFKHQDFLLFPTWFHEQLEKTKLSAETVLPIPESDTLEIRYSASVEWTQWVDDFERIRQITDFHVLQDDAIRERFEYKNQVGIHVALVRVFRLDPPQPIPNEKKYGGCRSWVEIPLPGSPTMISVLSDEVHHQRKRLLEGILGTCNSKTT